MKKWHKVLRTVALVVCVMLVAAPTFLLFANVRVINSTRRRIFQDIASLPHHKVAIVLGTSPRFAGRANIYFTGRIKAAANLYKSRKVDRILVSGDNGTLQYNEPAAMEEALVKEGVPVEHITKDYAGFRTLDTMVRAHEVFGLTEATVVTDEFHLARALYFARAAGISADGFSAAKIPSKYTRSMRFRETMARARAVLDVDILHTGPKYLGGPIAIR